MVCSFHVAVTTPVRGSGRVMQKMSFQVTSDSSILLCLPHFVITHAWMHTLERAGAGRRLHPTHFRLYKEFTWTPTWGSFRGKLLFVVSPKTGRRSRRRGATTWNTQLGCPLSISPHTEFFSNWTLIVKTGKKNFTSSEIWKLAFLIRNRFLLENDRHGQGTTEPRCWKLKHRGTD